MVTPPAVFGMPDLPIWLRERARAEAAKAPPPSPERIARLTIHFADTPPAVTAEAA